jgi:hypothetical protein
VELVGDYWVTATTDIYALTDTVQITGFPRENDLFIPNAFTPNGNDLNEQFISVGEGIAQFRMLIFNRWGEKYLTRILPVLVRTGDTRTL